MKQVWKTIIATLKEAYKNAFGSAPFHIIGRDSDNLTKNATFSIKAKRIPTISKLTTKEIMFDDRYLCGLSASDRKQIEVQYLLEIRQPRAYIEEYPLSPNKNNQFIFKILLIEDKKIVCGSAAYFIEDNQEILSMLRPKDVVKISLEYYLECYGEIASNNLIGGTKTNVHYLK